jgi:hypothetical protein
MSGCGTPLTWMWDVPLNINEPIAPEATDVLRPPGTRLLLGSFVSDVFASVTRHLTGTVGLSTARI